MINPQMNVVRFDSADVIATSGGPVAFWSAGSYRASTGYTLAGVNASTNYGGTGFMQGDYYNVLDGIGSTLGMGDVFTQDKYYHYDEMSAVPDTTGCYWNWKTCTDVAHRQ